jgi:hypothetical protein
LSFFNFFILSTVRFDNNFCTTTFLDQCSICLAV